MRKRFLRLTTSAWFIAFVALLLRIAFVVYKACLIPAVVLATVPFQNEAANVASSLAHGQGFCCLFRQPTGPTAWLAPVYPLLLASVFKLLGTFTLASFYAAVLLNCVLSSLVCVPLFYAAMRVGGRPMAVFSSWLWAIFPSGVILPFEWIWDTSLSALLAAVLLWATLRLPDSFRRHDFALYGLLCGFSLLTNPALGSVLPFLLLWVFVQHQGSYAQRTRLVLVATTITVLVCFPWTIRNQVQFHRFIPLRSNFPFELWSGNNEIFDEHSRAVNRITRYEQARLYAQLGENAFLDEKWQKAGDFIRTHRFLYAQLFTRRVVATWLGTESPWTDLVRTDSSLARFMICWNALTLLAVILGSVRLYLRGRPYFLPLAAFPFIFPLTFYIAHTSLRHRHPCDPILALLIAVAVTGVRIQNESEVG